MEDPGGSSTDRSFEARNPVKVIVVRHWTNAKDHVYIADKAEIEGLIVAFVNGNEQPILQVQDMKNVGSHFDRDAITYKIKFPFGVGIGAYQAFYAHDVA